MVEAYSRDLVTLMVSEGLRVCSSVSGPWAYPRVSEELKALPRISSLCRKVHMVVHGAWNIAQGLEEAQASVVFKMFFRFSGR